MLGRSRRAVTRLRQQPQAQQTTARRKRQRATPPNVVGKGPLLSAPGLTLGVAVIVRDEAPYLEEWLAYHHALGVQHFFLYDNGSSDDLHAVIERWVNHGLVTVLHWPLPGGQIDAYNHALRFFGPSLDWLAYFDVDEFIVPLVDDDIPSLLARWPDAADIRIARKDFGFSGHRSAPDGLTIEAYTEIANVFRRDPSKPLRVKTVLQPRGISAVGIHTATVADAPISADGRPVPTETVGKVTQPYVQLNHYYTRSFEEFEAKRHRGSATGRITRPAIPFELPALETDESALRFGAGTRAMMSRMASLDASPYRYGSELDLAQFPRFNDLGLFAEFAIVNTAADEKQLRREPAQRLQNQYAGIGFIGDISGFAHRPTRGDLSRSMHLAPLLERARGELETTWVDDEASIASSVSGGRVEDTEDGWRVTPEAEDVALSLSVDTAGRRRCLALGFVMTLSGPTRLRLELRRQDDDRGTPVELKLDHAATYAGVVEFDAEPGLVEGVTLSLVGGRQESLVHDLFVLSYG